jgi:hypothetical protein
MTYVSVRPTMHAQLHITLLAMPLLLFSLPWGAEGAVQKDEVAALPGWAEELPSKQYSGFLKAGPGKQFHYHLSLSEASPATDPLILWVQGGPGGSSMIGMFTEVGQFLVVPDVNSSGATLVPNPGSWVRAMCTHKPLNFGSLDWIHTCLFSQPSPPHPTCLLACGNASYYSGTHPSIRGAVQRALHLPQVCLCSIAWCGVCVLRVPCVSQGVIVLRAVAKSSCVLWYFDWVLLTPAVRSVAWCGVM